jgi:putative molybdopterin biosynthesis protein
MDFIPLRSEQYDLVMPRESYESDLLQPLLSLIRSPVFKHQVEALGGYDVSTMGEVVAELPAP